MGVPYPARSVPQSLSPMRIGFRNLIPPLTIDVLPTAICETGMPHQLTEDDIYQGYFMPKDATVMFNAWFVFSASPPAPLPENYVPVWVLDYSCPGLLRGTKSCTRNRNDLCPRDFWERWIPKLLVMLTPSMGSVVGCAPGGRSRNPAYF